MQLEVSKASSTEGVKKMGIGEGIAISWTINDPPKLQGLEVINGERLFHEVIETIPL